MLFMTMIIVSALSSPAASSPWQDPGCRRRLSLILPACEEKSLSVGLVIRGEDFYRWTGFPSPASGGLRLFTGAGPIPFQVEERNQAGELTAQGNGQLDRQDCLAFAMELTQRPQKLDLYYDGTPIVAMPALASTIQAISQTNQFYSLLITNGALTVGLSGGGIEPTTQNCVANYGRGALPLVVWQGIILANVQKYGPDYFPGSIGSSPGAPLWSPPVVIVQGPVRTIVEVRCNGYRQLNGEKETMRGDIVHYLAFWNGRTAVIDLEETVTYKSSGFEGSWPYHCRWPVDPSRELNENDCLLVTLADKVYTLRLGQTAEAIKQNPWRQLYATDNPEEGWFAWQYPKENAGIAMFYEKLETIRQRAAWVTYRPALHPVISMRTTPYKLVEINLSFKDRALRCRDRYHRDLRYVFLRSETPEDIRLLYKFWGQPLEQTAIVGRPEVKP